MEPRDQTGYFILSIGARKWKCQSGGERMNVKGAMASLCPKHLINCLFSIFPAWFAFLYLFAAKILMAIFESRKWRN